jgi:hypothetical protein
MKLSRYIKWWVLVLAGILWASCEEEIIIDQPDITNRVVVEGFIENGLPPYVLLTRSQPFFGGVDLNDIGAYFIRDARITVYSETDSVVLQAYDRTVLSLLPDSLLKELIDSIEDIPDIVVYTIPFDDLFIGEINKTYRLKVEVDDKVLTATTHIPSPVAFDSLYVQPHPDPEIDTLVQLWGRMKDPDTSGNYYRYFTRVNDGAWLTGVQTVFDDAFVNGKSFPIFIPKGVSLTDKNDSDAFDADTYGYWNKKDTCYVRLSSIDKPHYDFWRTLEADRSSQGNPFGSFVIVKSNILGGGIGIWGGYSSTTAVYIPRP